MITVKDVAKKAGVSVGTVSRYFNCPEKLTPEFYKLVQMAVDELKYQPSSIARSMRTKQTHMIAYVTQKISNQFYATLYDAIHKTCAVAQYTPVIYTLDLGIKFLQNLLTGNLGQVDGVILGFINNDEVHEIFNSTKSEIPIVLMTSRENNKSYNTVISDLFHGGYEAAQHILSIGHKKVAYIGSNDGYIYSEDKLSGVLQCFSQHEITLPDEYLFKGPPLYSTGFNAAANFMRLPSPPTAIIADNDILAVGCVKYLQENHYRVPQDVAVIGFDNITEASVYTPSISTMDQHIAEMGAMAATLLINKINHPKSPNKQAVFRPSIVVRQSTQADAPSILEL